MTLDMNQHGPCSALIGYPNQPGQCANGFPVHSVACFCATALPERPCCREEWCGETYESNGGKPESLTDAGRAALDGKDEACLSD
jgi:hypothetical protein